MSTGLAAAIATNRYGLGARPGEIRTAGADPRGWLRAQLRAPYVARPELSGLADSATVLAGFLQSRELKNAARAVLASSTAPAGAAPAGSAGDPVRALADGVRQRLLPHHVAQVEARTRIAVRSEASFRERLVHFWSNHFAVSVDKPICVGLAGALENEAIRPRIAGRFEDLLLAVERHPAMIVYLDNPRSVGPSSPLGLRAARRGNGGQARIGINENLAREILELHTLGVDGGYSQADVTTFARVLTGWSIGGGPGPLAQGEPGTYQFRDALHEPGPKTVLGVRYGEDGEAQGRAVLKALAAHPATARHLATKLARHFVADDPPAALVERLARTYLEHDGALLPVYDALIDADEAWTERARKFKTPQDFVYSAYRAFDVVPSAARGLVVPFEALGQPQFRPGSPAGWPDRAQDWDGADALMKRIEWSVAYTERLGDARPAVAAAHEALGARAGDVLQAPLQRASSGSQALALVLMSPEFQRR